MFRVEANLGKFQENLKEMLFNGPPEVNISLQAHKLHAVRLIPDTFFCTPPLPPEDRRPLKDNQTY